MRFLASWLPSIFIFIYVIQFLRYIVQLPRYQAFCIDGLFSHVFKSSVFAVCLCISCCISIPSSPASRSIPLSISLRFHHLQFLLWLLPVLFIIFLTAYLPVICNIMCKMRPQACLNTASCHWAGCSVLGVKTVQPMAKSVEQTKHCAQEAAQES